MKIQDYIKKFFGSNRNVLLKNTNTFADLAFNAMPFGKTLFISCVEMVTDLINDVTFTLQRGDKDRFNSFVAFVNNYGEFVLNKIYNDGFVVLADTPAGICVLNSSEYTQQTNGTETIIKPNNPKLDIIVLKSQTFATHGVSDFVLCTPFIKYLDNILSASNSTAERMGVLVVMTPKNPNNAPVTAVLSEEQKKELEKEIQTEYGALRRQNTIAILPREMNTNTISLASLDLKVLDKVKMAVLAIAGKLKVPANQVPLIDAMSSKSLSNGGELKEGDFAKYQTFERLLNKTFIALANAMLLKVDYQIYNKPQRNV
jgi:hypothetical protein